jgi:hypothetical protein
VYIFCFTLTPSWLAEPVAQKKNDSTTAKMANTDPWASRSADEAPTFVPDPVTSFWNNEITETKVPKSTSETTITPSPEDRIAAISTIEFTAQGRSNAKVRVNKKMTSQMGFSPD